MGLGSGSQSLRLVMCVPSTPTKPRRVVPPSRLLPSSPSPPDPTPSVRPMGRYFFSSCAVYMNFLQMCVRGLPS